MCVFIDIRHNKKVTHCSTRMCHNPVAVNNDLQHSCLHDFTVLLNDEQPFLCFAPSTVAASETPDVDCNLISCFYSSLKNKIDFLISHTVKSFHVNTVSFCFIILSQCFPADKCCNIWNLSVIFEDFWHIQIYLRGALVVLLTQRINSSPNTELFIHSD